MAGLVIEKAFIGCEREPLKGAFGFKGNALTYLLQTAVALYSEDAVGVGSGVQSVLWSDSAIFAKYGEDKGNLLMYKVSQYAVEAIRGMEFADPYSALAYLFPLCCAYAEELCRSRVSETFVLNALVPIDFAMWMLFAKKSGMKNFGEIFDSPIRHSSLANIPLITYGADIRSVLSLASCGTPIFKIKIGSDPDKDGSFDKMLLWDMNRALEIHEALKDFSTDRTESGRIVYYFDANGRYDSIERLERFIDFIADKGILERTVLFEEPFSEESSISVSGLPCIFAADESVHNLSDLKKRIDLGYRALTLKPIAKTLSLSLQMQRFAEERGIESFCADLTVNPVMREWNKSVAARLAPIKGLKIGVVESNGAQNYLAWDKMLGYLPAKCDRSSESVYRLDSDFFGSGIFDPPPHYLKLANEGKEYGK